MADGETLHRFYLVTDALRSAMQVDMRWTRAINFASRTTWLCCTWAYVEWKRRNLNRERTTPWNCPIDDPATQARRPA